MGCSSDGLRQPGAGLIPSGATRASSLVLTSPSTASRRRRPTSARRARQSACSDRAADPRADRAQAMVWHAGFRWTSTIDLSASRLADELFAEHLSA